MRFEQGGGGGGERSFFARSICVAQPSFAFFCTRFVYQTLFCFSYHACFPQPVLFLAPLLTITACFLFLPSLFVWHTLLVSNALFFFFFFGDQAEAFLMETSNSHLVSLGDLGAYGELGSARATVKTCLGRPFFVFFCCYCCWCWRW